MARQTTLYNLSDLIVIHIIFLTLVMVAVQAQPPPTVPLTYDDPIDCTTAVPPVVGFDISNGQAAADAMEFLTDLENDGHTVGTLDLDNGAIPDCVDVLIISGLAHGNQLTEPYTAAEGSMLATWVSAGHGLMVLGEWGFLKADTQELFTAFGQMQLGDDDDVVSDPTDYDANSPPIVADTWVIYQADNFADHPIFNGVATIELLRSSWLQASAEAVITTDIDAVPSQVPVITAGSHGAGCVIMAADSNWIGQIDSAYQKEANALAARQMVAWLQHCSTLFLTKTASSHFVRPGQNITYTISASNNASAALTNVAILDTVPADTSFVWATDPHTGPDVNGLITWPLGTLPAGASAAVTLVVQADNGLPHGRTITNTATVNSAEGLTDTATAIVDVIVLLPVAAAGGPYYVNEGSAVTLDGTASSDPDNLPLTYDWDFDNDGQYDDASGSTPLYSAAALDDGTYPVSLQIDNGQYQDEDDTAVTVLNVAPVVTLSAGTAVITAGHGLDLTAAFTDPGVLDTHIIDWDFGDGNQLPNGPAQTSHTFLNPGTFTLQVTVTDDDGGSGQDSVTVTVVPGTPGGSDFFIILPVVLHNYCQKTVQYADVVLAMDTSGSMNESFGSNITKLAAAKTAAIEFVNLMTFPGDQVSIVSFNQNAVLEEPLQNNRAQLIATLAQLTADGETRLDLAINTGNNELTGPNHLPTNTPVLILLTDGRPNGTDEATVLAEAALAKNSGTTIYTIGLGDDVNASLLQQAASSPAHYHFAPSAAELSQIYDEIAATLTCNQP